MHAPCASQAVRACILRKWCPVSHVTFEAPLRTSHIFTLHTPHYTLHTPHFTLHTSHSTLHLIWALLTLSQLISSHLISSHMSSKLSWITSQYYFDSRTCMRQPGPCVRALCEAVTDVKSHTKVSHHHSLSVFLCDVKSHTKVSHHPLLSVFLCDVKSHTTLHWVYCLQGKVIHNSEDCFPTIYIYYIIYIIYIYIL